MNLRDVAIDRHFLIFVSLPEDAPVALLDFRWFPGSIEAEAFLDIGASTAFEAVPDIDRRAASRCRQ